MQLFTPQEVPTQLQPVGGVPVVPPVLAPVELELPPDVAPEVPVVPVPPVEPEVVVAPVVELPVVVVPAAVVPPVDVVVPAAVDPALVVPVVPPSTTWLPPQAEKPPTDTTTRSDLKSTALSGIGDPSRGKAYSRAPTR